MRFARGNMRTTSFRTKTTTELRIGATDYCSGGVPKNQLLRDFRRRSIFDFCNNICQIRTSSLVSGGHLTYQ